MPRAGPHPEMSSPSPLWTCPECGQTFVTRNASHSCVQLTLDEFFGERGAQRELYELTSWLRDAYEVGVQS